MAPSAPPAPIMVCISSKNSITLPLSCTSQMTFLILSSNSPRYLEPATIPDRSRVRSLLFWTVKGTSPATMRRASPSTTAVFPTPGSPIRQGLFLVLRLKISITRLISLSLPITGSSPPDAARAVKSLLYCSRAEACLPLRFCFLPRSSLYRLPSWPMEIRVSAYSFWTETPRVFKSRTATFSPSLSMARRICSVPVAWAPKRSACLWASSSTFRALGEYPSFSFTATVVSGMISSFIISSILSSSAPFPFRTLAATPVFSLNSPTRICSVPT